MPEKAPDITPFQRFLRLLKPDSQEFKAIYIYAVFHGLVSLSLHLGIQAIINLIQGGRISTSFILLVIIVVFGIVIAGILQVQQLRMTKLERQYAPELMNRFFDTMSVQKGAFQDPDRILGRYPPDRIRADPFIPLSPLLHPFQFIADHFGLRHIPLYS